MPAERTYRFHRIDISFVGASTTTRIVAGDPFSDYFNYYTEGTPEAGAVNVQHFRTVEYRDIAPGIDVRFHLKSEAGTTAMEYDFVVHPGADMSTTTVLGNLYFDWANDSAFTPYVGAGIGYGALRLAQREPKASVYAFEPRLARYEYLSRNVALNALGDRVRLFALALGREAGSLLLANADQAPMRVPTISLDDWGQQSGVQPDFIHCACAGRAVFEGARATLAQHRPRVFCALRDERSALVQLFSELGYRAWVVGEYGLREAGLLHPEEPAEYGVFLHRTAHGRLMDELTDSESACAGQADA